LKIRAVPLVVAFSLVAALGMNGGAAVARPVDRSRGAGVVDHYPDFVKYGYLVGDRARFDRLKAEAIRRAAARHPSAAHPSAAHPSTIAAPVANPSFQGAYDNAGAPPDTTGAIGPQSFVEAVNSRIDVYSRTGTHLGGNTFTDALGPCESGVSGGLCEYSDPQVLYDLGTNRFYYEDLNADLSGNRNVFKFGFSKSSAPTTFDQTQWCNYTIDFGYGTSIPDYPKMAVTADFAVIGVNVYTTLVTYVGSDIDTIAKPKATGTLTSCPAASTLTTSRNGPQFNCDGSPFASDPNPAVHVAPSKTTWVVGVPDATNSGATGNYVDIIKISKDATTGGPLIGPAQCVTVPAYSPPAPAVQRPNPPTPEYTIDTLDGRIDEARIAFDPRIGGPSPWALWTAHAVSGGLGSQVDWYEIDVAHAKLFQNGSVSGSTLDVFDPSIASDRRPGPAPTYGQGFFGSDMVLNVSTSGPNNYPAAQMVSKVGANPQSALVKVKGSPGPYADFSCSQNPIFPGKCRWGDYSGAVPDPFAPTTGSVGRVWCANEWTAGVNDPFGTTWRTWIWQATP